MLVPISNLRTWYRQLHKILPPCWTVSNAPIPPVWDMICKIDMHTDTCIHCECPNPNARFFNYGTGVFAKHLCKDSLQFTNLHKHSQRFVCTLLHDKTFSFVHYEYAGYGLWISKLLCELYCSYYRICNTFGGDFNLAVLWFWLWLQNLMYTNTTCNHVYYEASWNNVCLISPCLTNIPISQSYCFPNILCIWHVVHKLLHEVVL